MAILLSLMGWGLTQRLVGSLLVACLYTVLLLYFSGKFLRTPSLRFALILFLFYLPLNPVTYFAIPAFWEGHQANQMVEQYLYPENTSSEQKAKEVITHLGRTSHDPHLDALLSELKNTSHPQTQVKAITVLGKITEYNDDVLEYLRKMYIENYTRDRKLSTAIFEALNQIPASGDLHEFFLYERDLEEIKIIDSELKVKNSLRKEDYLEVRIRNLLNEFANMKDKEQRAKAVALLKKLDYNRNGYPFASEIREVIKEHSQNAPQPE